MRSESEANDDALGPFSPVRRWRQCCGTWSKGSAYLMLTFCRGQMSKDIFSLRCPNCLPFAAIAKKDKPVFKERQASRRPQFLACIEPPSYVECKMARQAAKANPHQSPAARI